jgi:hypothetical protein
MVKKLSLQHRERLRQQFLTGPAAVLPAHVGHFLIWYAITEVAVTTMLAFVLDFRNFERLEYIVRGMDGRVKCERLRQATKRYMPLGPEIEARLWYFEQKVVPLRNRIAHSWPYLDETSGRVIFASVGIPLEGTPKFKALKANSVHLDEIFDMASWVHLFSQDLAAALASAIRGGSLEATSPLSDRPKESPKGPQPKAHRAKTDRRTRKPQRSPRS